MLIIRLATVALVLAFAVSTLAASPHTIKPSAKSRLTSEKAVRPSAKGGTKPTAEKPRKARTLTAFEMDAAGLSQVRY